MGLVDYYQTAFDCINLYKLWKILEDMSAADHIIVQVFHNHTCTVCLWNVVLDANTMGKSPYNLNEQK